MSMNRYVIKSKSLFQLQIVRSRKSFGYFLKFIGTLALICLIIMISIYKFIQRNNHPLAITQNYIYIEPISSFFRKEHNKNGEKIDWHDYEYIEREKARFGIPGENGQPVYAEPNEEELNKKLFDENGYYGLISDKIALNRSVADFRHPQCAKLKYLKELPTVSIVIPFYNDHLSTLLRTVYSVINRSPKELLKEVILVNDHSTKDFLYGELEDHINKHLKHIVKLYVLPRRSGLAEGLPVEVCRMNIASIRSIFLERNVLLFLDSHTEASTNFLPPLLEPIAQDYRTCVCPFVDVIDFKTFAYRPQGDGSRGIFDWNGLHYHHMPLRPGDQEHPWSLYENPVMVGGLFAISAKFFWELGGYDPGLDIWGGEQYELSFKIWLCGGKMYDAPCSRIGHVFRGGMPFPNDRKGIDFITINYKRVAEVWMDEYKEYLYKRDPDRFARVSAGDISYQLYVKERQQCKPFKYFVEHVAPDMKDYYPVEEPPEFASGAIQSMADQKFCIDKLNRPKEQPLGIYYCGANKKRPQNNQHFTLRFYRDISDADMESCFDSYGEGVKRELKTFSCHHGQGNQYFRYDLETKQIIHGPARNKHCVEVNIGTQSVYVTMCNKEKIEQKWTWGFVNETNIRNWLTYGSPIMDKQEISDLSQK